MDSQGYCDVPKREKILSTFGAQHFREMSQLAMLIISKYPPDDYVYIGIGRSPSLLIAALQVIRGNDAAYTIPSGEVKHIQTDKLEPERFYPIFDKFFRPGIDKKNLVIDYVSSGRSLYLFGCLLHRYLKLPDRKNIKLLALCPDTHYLKLPSDLMDADADIIFPMAKVKSLLFENLFFSQLKEYSDYPSLNTVEMMAEGVEPEVEPPRLVWQAYKSFSRMRLANPEKNEPQYFRHCSSREL